MLNSKSKTCCFTGHRIIKSDDYDTLVKNLEKEVVKLIEKGILYFGAGGALGFDTIAAKLILSLKETYPDIKLILILPCKNQHERWTQKQKNEHDKIKMKSDKIVYTAENYYRGCNLNRNRHLVDNSSYCIAYLRNDRSGTSYTVNYGKKQGIKIINI